MHIASIAHPVTNILLNDLNINCWCSHILVLGMCGCVQQVWVCVVFWYEAVNIIFQKNPNKIMNLIDTQKMIDY